MPAIPEIDDAALVGPLAAALGSASVELLSWHHQPIHYAFNQSTGGLYRVAGEARRAGATLEWSLILKVVHASDGPFGGSDDPTHPNYWKRELLMYESGMLEEIPGIRAPRCFGVDHVDRATAWIWLEDIADHGGSSWPPDRYEGAARRLGEFNGAYLNGRPLPTEDHLSRQWLRGFVDGFAPAYAEVREVRNHPLVRRCWPEGQFQRVQRLWADRGLLLGALDQLPQTFCHLDAFPRNLLVQNGGDEVVALDWSYAGIGAVGSELASMAAASVCFHDAEPDQLGRIDDLVGSGYLRGLRAAGWQGPGRRSDWARTRPRLCTTACSQWACTFSTRTYGTTLNARSATPPSTLRIGGLRFAASCWTRPMRRGTYCGAFRATSMRWSRYDDWLQLGRGIANR